MRKAALLTIVASCGITATTAQAHFLYHKKHLTLEQRVNYFERSIQHEQRAIHWFQSRLRQLDSDRGLQFQNTSMESKRFIKYKIVWHIHALRWHKKLLSYYSSKLYNSMGPFSAIRYVFGIYSAQAISVSGCETGGTYSVYSQNGQYLGLFQMGSNERNKYGHSNKAYGQAVAAYSYFVDSGRDWSPWSCQP